MSSGNGLPGKYVLNAHKIQYNTIRTGSQLDTGLHTQAKPPGTTYVLRVTRTGSQLQAHSYRHTYTIQYHIIQYKLYAGSLFHTQYSHRDIGT